MKKIIAALAALTALTCTLTACGSSSDSSDTESKTTSTASAAASEDTSEDSSETSSDADAEKETEKTTAEVTEATTEPAEKPTKAPDKSTSDVEEAFSKMVDSVNSLDAEAYLYSMYPSKLMDLQIDEYMKEAGKTREEILDEYKKMLESSSSMFPITYSDLEVKDVSDSISDIQDLLFEYIDDIDDETLKNIDFSPKDYLNITKACQVDVTFKYSGGFTENEITDNDITFIAYYLESEGWKFDDDLADDLDDAKRSSVNAAASSLQKGATAALTDLDAKGKVISGTFIISSDDSLNYNVPAGFDVEELKKYIGNYFDKLNDYDYFIVCKNCNCVYSAVHTDKSEFTGIYPSGTIYEASGPDYTADAKKKSFNELYEICKSNVK